ncbi:MAG: CpaD family pilus assembly lipoprotein [Sphingomicrobium sp.]
MRKLLLVPALLSGLSACQSPTTASQGLEPLHVPVVSTTDYVWDAGAQSGALSSEEAARLDGWFAGLGLDFGDSIYIAPESSPIARSQVAQIAGSYGLLVSAGAPASATGGVPGAVRVVVSRRRATVPGCPDWSRPSTPNFGNDSLPSFGCGVNTNLAMQVADPQDLLRGRAGLAAEDAQAAAKAIIMYRNWVHTALRQGQQDRPLKYSLTSSIKEQK